MYGICISRLSCIQTEEKKGRLFTHRLCIWVKLDTKSSKVERYSLEPHQEPRGCMRCDRVSLVTLMQQRFIGYDYARMKNVYTYMWWRRGILRPRHFLHQKTNKKKNDASEILQRTLHSFFFSLTLTHSDCLSSLWVLLNRPWHIRRIY